MEPTPREKDKLLIFTATLLAERRKERGLVPEMTPDVQVEATFPDGSKLVTVHHPIV